MTARSLSAPFLAAIALPNVQSFPMVELQFDVGDGGTDYICGCNFDVTYGGHTYLGAGGLISIDPIMETQEMTQGVLLSISGGPAAQVSRVLTAKSQGRLMLIRVACLDASNNLVVDDNVWLGMMDAMSISDKLDNSRVTIPAEHMLAIWDRPRPVRYTDSQQQKIFAGDLGLQYIEEMAEINLVWPGKEFFQ